MSHVVQAPVLGGPQPAASIPDLIESFRSRRTTPAAHLSATLQLIADRGDDGTWISVIGPEAAAARAAELADDPAAVDLPLYGVPFGVKDSIDVAGWPTTLACPDYAYQATRTAPAVQQLIEAGAIMIGKTNLDQFATGLNGTRTGYTIPRSVYGDELISGGSSSGSALAVALGQVPFTVATDTAGSGRVPPALNGVVGYKPSRGLISTVGLVPACRSLDCLSVIAGRVEDAATVFELMTGRDDRDPWNRPRRHESISLDTLRIALPAIDELEFFGDRAMASAHLAARDSIAATLTTTSLPLAPFLAAGELLYAGPWVAERLVEFGDFLADHPDGVVPVVRDIIAGGSGFSAMDVFRAQYRLAELKSEVTRLFELADVLVLPTIGTTFTVDEVLADPIRTNTVLGHYTHFGNLLDLCAAAVPMGETKDGRPVSVMVLGPALSDDAVLAVAGHIAAPH